MGRGLGKGTELRFVVILGVRVEQQMLAWARAMISGFAFTWHVWQQWTLAERT
jgi:hypothetical protein